MTYGVPKELLEKIRANEVHELEILRPDHEGMMVEQGSVAFQEKEGSEPPYRHVGAVSTGDNVHVGAVEEISEPIPVPGGKRVRIRWGGPAGGIAPISFTY